LRAAFQQALAKVYLPNSVETGVVECHRMINHYSQDPKMLRIFISTLTDKTILQQDRDPKNHSAMGFHAAMFGYLASTYQK